MASSLYVTAETQVPHAPAGFSVTDVLLLCMALIWGLNFIVVKYATTVFAPLAFNSTRIAVALVILWAILLARRTPLPPRREVLAMIGLGVLGNGLYQILWVEGMARTRASDAALLVAASPAFIELLGWMRGNERLGTRGMAGIALSMAGIGLVVSGGASSANHASTLAGNALILSSVLCWAIYSVTLKPFTLRHDGLTLSAVTMTGGMLAMLVAALPDLAATQWSHVSPMGWAAVAYSSVMALVVAYLFFYRGLRTLGPTRTSMYSNLQPLFAMAGAWALLAETPRTLQVAGGACIVAGLLLTRLPGRDSVVAVE
jgi:drug/metabolite transporter (DMT)-like permease